MLLRNIFGWDLIDLSYTSLNETKLKKSGTMNKNADKKKGAEARRPTFDDLSIQVPSIPYNGTSIHTYALVKNADPCKY